jgi:HTH-type transcriptional regulator / antitoxin HipB
MKTLNEKQNNKKTYSFQETFDKGHESKNFQKIYNEELAQLRLAEQIKKMRLEKNFTQETLAQKAKMPQSVIARIESGTHSYSLGTLYRIAHVFNKEICLA